MNGPVGKLARCAIYTRKSSEHNLDLAFSSLDAQREACEAYIKSQAQEGWRLIPGRYDDGAFSGASLERPALQQLLADVRAGTIDIVLVYKVDRLTRSLADFAKLIELFDVHGVSFVSVTQSFNTSSSMGRLTLNVLLSFAQFERELIGERVRDKIAASKRAQNYDPSRLHRRVRKCGFPGSGPYEKSFWPDDGGSLISHHN
jgi:site-specific DNA recombinase